MSQHTTRAGKTQRSPKKGYTIEAEAEAAAERMARSMPRFVWGHYRCSVCDEFHVGRLAKSSNAGATADPAGRARVPRRNPADVLELGERVLVAMERENDRPTEKGRIGHVTEMARLAEIRRTIPQAGRVPAKRRANDPYARWARAMSPAGKGWITMPSAPAP